MTYIFKNKYLIFCTFRVKTIKLRRLNMMFCSVFVLFLPPFSVVVVLFCQPPHRMIYRVAAVVRKLIGRMVGHARGQRRTAVRTSGDAGFRTVWRVQVVHTVHTIHPVITDPLSRLYDRALCTLSSTPKL